MFYSMFILSVCFQSTSTPVRSPLGWITFFSARYSLINGKITKYRLLPEIQGALPGARIAAVEAISTLSVTWHHSGVAISHNGFY